MTVKSSLYQNALKLLRNWYNSNFLNSIRRKSRPWMVKLQYKIRIKDKRPIKLHLGCGNQHFDGYENVDLRKTTATDLVCDIKQLPYPNDSIEMIETYHAIEHLPRHDFPKALKEWYRILISGGRLVIEYPDLDEIVKKYLEGDEKQLDGIFGLQRFEGDCHLFGYNFERLRKTLEKCGFTKIERKPPQDYHAREWPCIRVECVKCDKDISSLSSIGKKKNANFTGERVVEGGTPERIWLDHVARYEFANEFAKGKCVLDIACGTGYGSIVLCRSGAKEVIGVDISDEAINFARAEYRMNGLEYRVGDVLDINFPQNYFDVITCFETIEHVRSQEKAFAELHRVLKPEGLLIISSPNRKLTSPGRSINDHPANPFHTTEYSTSEFISVLKKYFEILEVYGQRGRSKLFFLPLFETVMRKFLSGIYDPAKGSPDLEKVSPLKEYRYITAVCRKCGNKS